MSLVDEANNLPDDLDSSSRKSWYDQLTDEKRKDVDKFVAAFNGGELNRKFANQRKAARWLSGKLKEQGVCHVSCKTIEEHLRSNRK